MKKVVIVGAGAMGCLFAARLVEAGAEVTLIDVDEKRLAALRTEGVTLADDDGERTVPVRAELAADVSGPVDLLMLFTKGMHSAQALGSVRHLAVPGTCALTLQNGIGNAELIAEIFPPENVLLGMTDFPADLEGPTRVASHGQGHARLGTYMQGTGTAAAQAVAALLDSAGLDTQVDPHVQVAIWEKVAFNAALNAIATITGLTVGEMDAPAGRRIAEAVVDETVATAESHDIHLERARILDKIDFALKNHRSHKASMLQDRLAGRRTEIETINGAIVRAAKARGVATPVTATLADLVRLNEPRE